MTPDQFKLELIDLLPRLRRFARGLTRSESDTDDLLQDVCSQALQNWDRYDPAQPLDRWIFRITRNLWIDEMRKRKVRLGEGQIPAEDASELSSDPSGVDVLMARKVRQNLSDLDDTLSQPLLLVCAEGYSYQEAADMLEIPIGTVMSRIHRARKRLAAQLTMEACVPS